MSEFERIYQIDPMREAIYEREHKSIELTDQQLLERITPTTNAFGFVYKPSHLNENEMSPELKKKFEKARKLTTETIKLKKMYEKNESKSAKGKPKKNDTQSKSTAMASIQS